MKQGHGVIAADFSKGCQNEKLLMPRSFGARAYFIDRQTGTLRIPHIDAQGCFVGDEGPFKVGWQSLPRRVYYPVICELEP